MDARPSISPNEPFNSRPELPTPRPFAGGNKRAAENGEAGDLAMESPKRARTGAEKEANRVAEIVLVLSAMWRMRGGGRGPTEAELRLMAEAREKVVEMCEGLAPRDIVAREAIVGLIEDLGLNGRVRDQRLGFRGQKLSIKEKVELTKRKMEESKKFTTQTTTYTSHPHPMQTSFGTAPETRGPSNTIRIFSTADKMSPSPTITSGGFPALSPSIHVSAATSTLPPYQSPTSEVKVPTITTGFSSSQFGRDTSSLAMPRNERPQIKLEGGSNGSSYTSQTQANSSSKQPLVNAPTWSVLTQSASAKPGPDSKLPNLNPAKVEVTTDMLRTAPQAARDQTFRPFLTQIAPGNIPSMHQPSQCMNLVQAPQFNNNHNDIAKIVQKLLHPKLPEHPAWTPPSREYMNKALTCQVCKLTVNEVETVVLCDACEKGFHLKCLQLNNQKIPRSGEWHCMSCLKLSNGKPLPPKYGRVMRSINASKMPSNTCIFQSSSDKKLGPIDPKVNQQKIIVNGSSTGSGTAGGNSVELASGLNIQNSGETKEGNLLSSTKDADQEISLEPCPNYSMKCSGVVCDSSSVGSSRRLTQSAQVFESSTPSERLAFVSSSEPTFIMSNTIDNNYDNLHPSQNSQVVRTNSPNFAEVSIKTNHENKSTAKTDGQDVRPSSAGSSGFSSDFLHNVEWVGDLLQIMDGKKFYQSCCIRGVTYKVQDHALLHFNLEKLVPSKLQAMWEDCRTGSKWVMVNRCFFPGDLPEAVGCPYAPESSELYDSNNESTVMAGLIQGPCAVLTTRKFKEETERLSLLGTKANNGQRQLFLCKWFYDELKGVFRPVSG